MACLGLACVTDKGCIEILDLCDQDGMVVGCQNGEPTWVDGNITLNLLDGCAAGGVGSDYAIRNASINNGVLTLGGAPEHTAVTATIRNFGQSFGPNPGQTPMPITDQTDLVPLELTMTNPSPCREMVGVVQFGAPQFFGLKPFADERMTYAAYMSVYIDGAIQDDFPSRTDVYFDITTSPNNFQFGIDTQTMPYILPFTIAPGGTVTFNSHMTILVFQANPNGQMGLGIRRITAWGMTR